MNFRPGSGADSLFHSLSPFSGAHVTFESVRNVDLRALNSAVSSLDTLVGKLATMDEDARNMDRMAWASEWRGENAGASKPVVEQTANKFIAAHEQAQALHSILQSLLGDLHECQEALGRYEQNAAHWGAHLSTDGTIRTAEPPYTTLAQARVMGLMPFGEAVPPETLESMNVLEHEIVRVIERAAESDRVAARELSTLMSRSGGQFSTPRSPTMRDAADAQALEDARTVVELGSKETRTAADWRRMGDHFAQHADDPLFAQYVVDSLGMEAYLALGQELDYAATELAAAHVDIESIRTGMGNTFVTAMKPPGTMETHPPGSPAYDEWLHKPEGQAYQRRLEALHAIGTDIPYQPGPTPFLPDQRLGYDIALDLLEAADLPVDDQFFYQLTSDLIDVEQNNPGIWDRQRYTDGTLRDVRNDAVDRLLGIGAQNNPEAVASFFDPDGNGTGENHIDNRHLDYFIGDGENTRNPPREFLEHSSGYELAPGSPGLAAALEAAATGLAPGTQPGADYTGHSPANARVAEHVWNTFAADPSRIGDNSAFAYLAPTLGNIGAEYMSDVYKGITGADTEFGISPRPDFSPVHTERLVSELAKNAESNASMTSANQVYLQVGIDKIISTGDGDVSEMRLDVGELSRSSGLLAGILTEARAKDAYDSQIASDESRNSVVDTVNTWTDRALNVAIYEVLGSDFAGLASLTDAVKGDITSWTFGLLKVDNSDTAESAAMDEIEVSLQRHKEIAEHAVDSAIDRSGFDILEEDGQKITNSAKSELDTGYRLGYVDPSPREN
ncbi:hypothetical protein HUT13_10065 [Streptomyces harbinensis]|uniref:hypothetical protein n=1 Tax=Streptomyces harbinensis TaxID=1176198 RepID=UPI00158FD41B|nr:hypothetical protein [Streptomyces harbinensis]QKV69093.1 hypothetical protein HUT13_10065 [Streptomyces harbinensis]